VVALELPTATRQSKSTVSIGHSAKPAVTRAMEWRRLLESGEVKDPGGHCPIVRSFARSGHTGPAGRSARVEFAPRTLLFARLTAKLDQAGSERRRARGLRTSPADACQRHLPAGSTGTGRFPHPLCLREHVTRRARRIHALWEFSGRQHPYWLRPTLDFLRRNEQARLRTGEPRAQEWWR
jgi:hypothetical protein